jgi:hypothetical protein
VFERICHGKEIARALVEAGYNDPWELPFGQVLCRVDVWKCEQVCWPDDPPPEPELSFGDYRPGRWMWHLKDVFRCQPLPAVGKQGFWTMEIAASEIKALTAEPALT